MSKADFLVSMAGLAHTTMTREQLRKLLMETGGQLMASGKLWNITSKHLGAGIYKVSTKQWKP